MPKVNILRQGRPIGFMTVPQRALEAKSYPLLERFGEQRGFAIVVQIDGTPFACVVYRWDGASIDVTQPGRFLWPSKGRAFPKEASFLFTRQKIEMSETKEGFAGYFSHEEFRERPERPWAGEPFELEIEDESVSGRASFRGIFDGPFFWRGYFRADLSNSGLGGEGRLRIDLEGRRPIGFGEGYVRWRGREGAFELDFETSRRSRIPGLSARFRAQGRFSAEAGWEEASDEFSLPASILWLVQSTFTSLSSGRASELSIWVGPVSYNDRDVKGFGGIRQVLAESLLLQRTLTVRDVSAVMNWLRTSAPLGEKARYYLREESERLIDKQVRERERSLAADLEKKFRHEREALQSDLAEKTSALRQLQKKTREQRKFTSFQLTFDSSLTAEKAVLFLAELFDAIAKKGGHLCFDREGAPGDG
jgi:hypothetical protein